MIDQHDSASYETKSVSKDSEMEDKKHVGFFVWYYTFLKAYATLLTFFPN